MGRSLGRSQDKRGVDTDVGHHIHITQLASGDTQIGAGASRIEVERSAHEKKWTRNDFTHNNISSQINIQRPVLNVCNN